MIYLDEKFLLDDFHQSGERQDDFEQLICMIDRNTRCADHAMKNLVFISIDEGYEQKFEKDQKLWPETILCSLIDPQGRLVNRVTIAKEDNRVYRIIAPSVYRRKIGVYATLKKGNFGAVIKENIKTSGLLVFNKEVSGREKGEPKNKNTPQNRGDYKDQKGETDFDLIPGESGNGWETAVFFSKMALKTLAQRLSLTAKPLLDKGLERDLFLAKLMNRDEHVTVVMKQYGGIAKIFAVLGGEFVNTKLFLICELYSLEQSESRFGKMCCVRWDVTHKRAVIRFSFPEHGEKVTKKYGLSETLTPYVEYISSDTGENSLVVKSFWMTESGHYFPDKIFSKKHRGKSEEAETIKHNIDEIIFSDFERVPRRLSELKSTRISPEDFDPDSARWRGRNRNIMLCAFRNVLKKIDDSSKCIGKARKIKLAEIYDYAIINETAAYTAYELLMDVSSLPARIQAGITGFPDTSEEILRKFREYCIANALWLDYERIAAEAQNQAAKKSAQGRTKATA